MKFKSLVLLSIFLAAAPLASGQLRGNPCHDLWLDCQDQKVAVRSNRGVVNTLPADGAIHHGLELPGGWQTPLCFKARHGPSRPGGLIRFLIA